MVACGSGRSSGGIFWAAVATVVAASICTEGLGAVLHWRPLNEPGSGGWISSVAVSPHDPRRVLLGGDMLGVGLSTDGGESWQSTFGFASWEIADFTFHPDDPEVVWVGTMSGPYVSADGGRNWRARRSGFPPIAKYRYSAPIQKVLFDPSDTRRLLAFGGSHRGWRSPGKPLWGAVWESTDDGGSWRRIATIAGGKNVRAVAFAAGSSTRLYAGVAGAGIFASEDGGETWSARNAELPHTDVNRLVVHPTKPGTLWAALANHAAPGEKRQPGGVYRSEDGGRTWRSALAGLSQKRHDKSTIASHYRTLAVSPTDPDVLLTSDCSWQVGVLYKSSDGGESWRRLAERGDVDCAYPAGLGLTVAEFSPIDAEVAFVAGSEYVLRTFDGGKTWVDVTSRRVPGTKGWRGRGYSGLCSTGFAFDPGDPKHAVLLAMDHGNFWQSRDGLTSWIWGGKGLDNWGGSTDVAFAGRRTMYASFGQNGSFGGIGRTTDGGETWTLLDGEARGLPRKRARAPAGCLHALPDEPDVVWAVIRGRLNHTEDGGEHWRVLPVGEGKGDTGINWIAPLRDEPRSFFVSGRRGVWRTDDGEHFEHVPGGPTPAYRIRVDGNTPPALYATSWRKDPGGLWRLAGGTWARLRDDAFIRDVAVDPTDPDRIAVATHDNPFHDECFATGVWISADGGATWSQENEGLACLRGPVITFNPHNPEQLVFGTSGRGFFVSRWRKHR